MPWTRTRRLSLGGIKAAKLGMPSAFADLYHSTMELSWPAFVALVACVFTGINLLFGAIYAAMPGAIADMAPGSLLDGFFFSVDTLGTVGYGVMAPRTHLGHAVASAEVLVGLFFSATITGLIFARFSRPRDAFVFARYAVIGDVEGQRALSVRLATTRVMPIAGAVAQLFWFERVEAPDGRVFRRTHQLPLTESFTPTLVLAWTLVHPLEQGSPVLAALGQKQEFHLMVSINGTDTLLASQAVGSCYYPRERILIDHAFVDAVRDRAGVFELDLHKLDEVRALAPAAVAPAA